MSGRRPPASARSVWIACGLAALLTASLASCVSSGGQRNSDWRVYGGDAGGDRFSMLRQIDPANVCQLEVTWQYDMDEPGDSETTPIVIEGVLYAFTPTLNVIALDAATGRQIWRFDPGGPRSGPARGLTYWTDGHDRRLFAGIRDQLIALDPSTGQRIHGFGRDGVVDLREGLNRDPTSLSVSMTSPGMIYRDLIITGFRTIETHPAPPGDIRAFDVKTGSLRWSFHTVPRPGEPGFETWPPNAWTYTGAANNWAGFALDERRGIVYAPTGSAVYDFYGADRLGDDLYANTLLALDAATGKLLWHFQVVHHDLWDRDLPSPPSLVTINRDGKSVDAVVQASKQGFLYVFDRQTGSPLFPIAEHSFPGSEVPGEVSSPTQPVPMAPRPFARQQLTEDMLTTRSPEAHDWAARQFRELRSDGLFVPFGLDRATVVMPGFDGGAEWGGAAVDPHSAVLYINANDVAWTGRLLANPAGSRPGEAIYRNQCAVCHGFNRLGDPPEFPSLSRVGLHMTSDQVKTVLYNGRGRMPPFASLGLDDLSAVAQYILSADDASDPIEARTDSPSGRTAEVQRELKESEGGEGSHERYRFTGYHKFLDPDGYPAVAPPWGTLNAIDLRTGAYLWTVPLGEYPALKSTGSGATGSENYGGPIVTASGLVFIAATVYDRKIHAFDSQTGSLLWEHELPYSGTATPALYMANGREFLVVETNGSRDKKGPQGAAYVAFALPISH